jgi:hypothetical protein
LGPKLHDAVSRLRHEHGIPEFKDAPLGLKPNVSVESVPHLDLAAKCEQFWNDPLHVSKNLVLLYNMEILSKEEVLSLNPSLASVLPDKPQTAVSDDDSTDMSDVEDAEPVDPSDEEADSDGEASEGPRKKRRVDETDSSNITDEKETKSSTKTKSKHRSSDSLEKLETALAASLSEMNSQRMALGSLADTLGKLNQNVEGLGMTMKDMQTALVQVKSATDRPLQSLSSSVNLSPIVNTSQNVSGGGSSDPLGGSSTLSSQSNTRLTTEEAKKLAAAKRNEFPFLGLDPAKESDVLDVMVADYHKKKGTLNFDTLMANSKTDWVTVFALYEGKACDIAHMLNGPVADAKIRKAIGPGMHANTLTKFSELRLVYRRLTLIFEAVAPGSPQYASCLAMVGFLESDGPSHTMSLTDLDVFCVEMELRQRGFATMKDRLKEVLDLFRLGHWSQTVGKWRNGIWAELPVWRWSNRMKPDNWEVLTHEAAVKHIKDATGSSNKILEILSSPQSPTDSDLRGSRGKKKNRVKKDKKSGGRDGDRDSKQKECFTFSEKGECSFFGDCKYAHVCAHSSACPKVTVCKEHTKYGIKAAEYMKEKALKSQTSQTKKA